jgi:alpha-L-fucosidase
LIGSHLVYDKENDCIEQWTNERATVDWDFTVNKPGSYKILIRIVSEEESAIEVNIAGQTIQAELSVTGGFNAFKTFNAGKVAIDKAGDLSIHFKLKSKKWKPVKLQSVTLSPN